jgi:phosphatidylethanolamine-binding protein (PEBP) family uncharacterized protein
MKIKFHNLTGVSRSKIATAALALLISGATYGTPRIQTITFNPLSQSACIPATGSVSVSCVLSAVRGQNGTVVGVYEITGLPSGVTANPVTGFTATGNNPFPTRTLTLNISSTSLPGSHSFSVRLYNSQGVTDKAIVTGTLILNIAPMFSATPLSVNTNTDAGTCSAIINYTATATGYPAPAMSYNLSGATTASGNGTGSGSMFNRGITNVTITAGNVCSPNATASFTVTVNDNEAPIFTNCPSAMTISCDASSDVSSTGNAQAMDNCTGVSISHSDASTQNPDAGSPEHYNYTITRTFTARDEGNNASTCTHIITVQDWTAPSVACMENATRPTSIGLCSYTVSGNEFDAAASQDNCSGVMMNYTLSGATTATGTSSLDGMMLNKGITTIQWTASDVTGNSSSCSFDVTVNDTELPVITTPANIVTGNDAGLCGAVINYEVLFNDNCPGAILGQESGWPSGYMFPVGTTTNMFTVLDASGNTASASFTVTVYDNEAPTITSITKTDFSGYNVTCHGSCNGSVTVNATDNCSSPISYLWSNGETTATATYLCAGVHTVMVSDGINSLFMEITITEPAPLEVFAGADAVTYYGYGANQTVNRDAQVTGGVDPFLYRWSMNRPLMCNMVTNAGDESMSSTSWSVSATCPESPMNFTMADAPLCFGSSVTATLLDDAIIYLVVMDNNGCVAADSFTVVAEDVRCFAGNSGTAKVQMCHRTGSAKNPWVEICVDPEAVPSHLAHGDYIGRCISARMAGPAGDENSALQVKVYPNPNNGNFKLDFHSAAHSNDDIIIELKNVSGQVVYSKTFATTDGHFEGMLTSGDLEEGFYIVNIRQGTESVNQTIIIMK